MDLGHGDMGNPNDLTVQKLPSSAADLTAQGVSDVVATLQNNPDQVAAAISGLQNNPKAVVARVFNMTALQYAALWQMSADQINASVQPAIEALQQGRFTGWKVDVSPVKVTQEVTPDANKFVSPDMLPNNPFPIHASFSCSFSVSI